MTKLVYVFVLGTNALGVWVRVPPFSICLPRLTVPPLEGACAVASEQCRGLLTMNYLKQKKDFRLRAKFKKQELTILKLKALARNAIAPLSFRVKALDLLAQAPKLTKVRNVCILTGRSRGVIKKFGLSRLVFKQMADAGTIPGVRRAS